MSGASHAPNLPRVFAMGAGTTQHPILYAVANMIGNGAREIVFPIPSETLATEREWESVCVLNERVYLVCHFSARVTDFQRTCFRAPLP